MDQATAPLSAQVGTVSIESGPTAGESQSISTEASHPSSSVNRVTVLQVIEVSVDLTGMKLGDMKS